MYNDKQKAGITEMANRHSQVHAERFSKNEAWLKGIITIASGLIAVLVSLKSGVSKTYLQHVVFVSTVALLSLGILFGTIVLYENINLLRIQEKILYDHLVELLNGSRQDMVEVIKSKKIYKICFYLCLTSFLLSLIALVVYASLIDIKQ